MVSPILAGLAAALSQTGQEVGSYQAGEEKKKKDAADLLLRQQAEARQKMYETAQMQNMQAMQALAQNQFNAQQGQIQHQNTRQSLMDLNPFTETPVPEGLAQKALRDDLGGMLQTDTRYQGFLPTSPNTDASLTPRSITHRLPTGEEQRQHQLEESTLKSQELQQETAQAALNASQETTRRRDEALARVQAAYNAKQTPNPMDILLASGHEAADVDPQIQMLIDRNKIHPQLGQTFTGYDDKGVPQFTFIPKEVGTNFAQKPTTQAGSQTRINDAKQLRDLAQATLDMGQQMKWSGVGPEAAITGPLAQFFGGNDNEIALRGKLDDIFSGIGHKRYGGALTPNEQAMLTKFTPRSTINGQVNAVYLNNIIQAMDQILAEGGGQPINPQSPNHTGSVPSILEKLNLLSTRSPVKGGVQ